MAVAMVLKVLLIYSCMVYLFFIGYKKPRKPAGTALTCVTRFRGYMKVSAMRQRVGGEMACVGGVSWKISLAEGEKNPLTLCRLNDLQYLDA